MDERRQMILFLERLNEVEEELTKTVNKFVDFCETPLPIIIFRGLKRSFSRKNRK